MDSVSCPFWRFHCNDPAYICVSFVAHTFCKQFLTVSINSYFRSISCIRSQVSQWVEQPSATRTVKELLASCLEGAISASIHSLILKHLVNI